MMTREIAFIYNGFFDVAKLLTTGRDIIFPVLFCSHDKIIASKRQEFAKR